jgi:hypothetical protein
MDMGAARAPTIQRSEPCTVGLGMDAIRKQLGCGMGRIQQVLKAAG